MSNALRYSQHPVDCYDIGRGSQVLKGDPQAWNLAWLSFDVDAHKHHPDPNFTVLVRRTLDFCFLTRQIDLTGSVPPQLKVRGLFSLPPPRAVMRVCSMRDASLLPLFQAYGNAWLDTIYQRSYLWRAPYDCIHDAPVTDTTEAAALLEAIAKKR